MARESLFDPADRSLFVEQRQRFDWALLQNGCVFRYPTRFGLHSAGNRLAGLGYLVHRIDGSAWTTVDDLHDALASAMSFPAYYGRNPAAFNDVLYDVAEFVYGSDPASTGTVLAIAGFDSLVELDRWNANTLLDIFARHARLAALCGHPMLCLVESTAADLERVGSESVLTGPLWDVEPDPPAPFHDGDVVENELQIYATEVGAVEYVARLREVLADTLDPLGRWQILEPVPVPERLAEFHAAHRPEPAPPGTRLWDVSVGLRGEGDHNLLADRIVHVLHDVGMRFDQLISGYHAAGTEARETAIQRFPDLA